MEKVSEKWFKDHGWNVQEYNTVEEDGVIRKGLTYSINSGKLHARYDRIIYTYPPKRKGDKKHISRFYMFYAKGCNKFEVENKISYQNYPVKTIIAALNAVGYDEFGNYIDK